MRITILLLALALLFSCAESEREYLQKVSDKLSEISTVNYNETFFDIVENQVVSEYTSKITFDFKDDNPYKTKFHSYSDHYETIYDGFKMLSVNHEQKLIITSDINNIDLLNERSILSLHNVKSILQKLLDNPDVVIHEQKDSMIKTTPLRVFSFVVEKGCVDFVNHSFKELEYDSEYFLYINTINNLPYKMVVPNGKIGKWSATYEDIEIDVKIDASHWSGENLPNEYEKRSEGEHYRIITNKPNIHVGKPISNLELPNLNDNLMVNLSELKGNVVLLDFWFKGCYPCVKSIPSLNKIASKFSKSDFRIYGIEYNESYSQDALIDYTMENNIKYPNLFKGKAFAELYDIQTGPTFMIIDKSGEIVYVKGGYTEKHMDEIETIIEKYI